jgi:DNA-binding Lrp family transcriptional regulator
MKLERFQLFIFWGNDFSQHFVTSNWLYCFPAENRRFFIFFVTNNSMAEKNSKERRIDETNKKLLQLLQKDSKQSIAKLSEVLGIGISSIHARMKSLKESGVIKQYSAVVDPTRVKRGTLAFILVTVRYRVPGRKGLLSQREFCEEIAGHPLVQGVHVLSGEYDVLLKVRAENIGEMNNFIVDFLRELPEVDKTLTMFAMDSYLDTLELRDLSNSHQL